MLKIFDKTNKEVQAVENFQLINKSSSPFKEILKKKNYSEYSLSIDDEIIQFKDTFLFQVNIKKSLSLLAFFKSADFNKDDIIPSLLELKNKEVNSVETAKEKFEATINILDNQKPLFYICVLQNKYSLSEDEIKELNKGNSYVLFIDLIEENKKRLPTEIDVEIEKPIEVVEEIQSSESETIEDTNNSDEEIQNEELKEDDKEESASIIEVDDEIQEPSFDEPNDLISNPIQCNEVITEPAKEDVESLEKTKKKEKPKREKKPRIKKEKRAKSDIFNKISLFLKRYKFHLMFLAIASFLISFSIGVIVYSISLSKAPHPLLYVCLLVGLFLNGFIFYDYFNVKKIKDPLFYSSIGSNLFGILLSIPFYFLYQSIDTNEEDVSAPASALLIAILISIFAIALTAFAGWLVVYLKNKRKKKEE